VAGAEEQHGWGDQSDAAGRRVGLRVARIGLSAGSHGLQRAAQAGALARTAQLVCAEPIREGTLTRLVLPSFLVSKRPSSLNDIREGLLARSLHHA
jgi:hypothetical protein